MAKFWTCEHGSNHDLGEKCDCTKEQESSDTEPVPPKDQKEMVKLWQPKA